MKLKQWLKEYEDLTYAEYQSLPQEEKWMLQYEHQRFCSRKQKHDSQGWRKMTPEEKERADAMAAKARERYETNLKIGGIDERGNYTALHHRWEEK